MRYILQSSSVSRLSGILGNLLEHYDKALFALLAPSIAPLFFPDVDHKMALLSTYAILPIGYLTKPIGALVFGKIGDSAGRKQALILSLVGMASATMAIGLLPTYAQAGILAPIMLALCRMLQSFFSAAETAGGAIFLLEHSHSTQKTLAGSFFDLSSMLGTLCASIAIFGLSLYTDISHSWRFLFLLGGVTGLFAIFVRIHSQESPEYLRETSQPKKISSTLRANIRSICRIALTSSFGHTTYALAFTFMTGFAPIITKISVQEIARFNTYLFLFDCLLLPIFGYLAQKIGPIRLMLLGTIGSFCTAIPLFLWITHNPSYVSLIFVRVSIIIWGVAFSAPYYAWALEQIPSVKSRYLILSCSSALSSQIFGSSCPAICLYLTTISPYLPGVYFALISLISMSTLLVSRGKTPKKTQDI